MFKRVLNEAIKWNIKWFFGSITATVGTFMLMHNIFEYEILRSVKYGVFIFILVLMVKMITQYVKEIDNLESKLEEQKVSIEEQKKSIDILDTTSNKKDLIKKYNYYGEVILALKDIFAQVNKIKRMDSPDKKIIYDQLIRTSNRTKAIFEKRFNYTYSVSIKVIEKNSNGTIDENSETQTIIRDEESYFKRKDNLKNGHKHLISENTCFWEILKNLNSPSKAYFFSNDLIPLLDYKNSSYKDYGNMPKDVEFRDRPKYWTLPYKSEIVVPISPLLYNTENRKEHFFGYLCVDCDELDGFHRKYDIENLMGIADGIYDLLEKWYLIKINENNEQTEQLNPTN